jgi:hypothetical protein
MQDRVGDVHGLTHPAERGISVPSMPPAAPVMNADRPVRSYAVRGMPGPYDWI